MGSYNVKFMTEKTITAWIPDNVSDAEKTRYALDHIALNTFQGEVSKLMSLEKTTLFEEITEPTNPPNVTPFK